jgi:hypothetical protein
MMQLTNGLQDKVWRQIEDGADPGALPRLRDALAQIDPDQRAAMENAAITLAGAWADAALWLGFQLATNPSAWIFAETEEQEA